MRPQLVFQGGTVYAGLYTRRSGYFVYLQHLVQTAQIDGDRASGFRVGLYAVNGGTTPAEGYHGISSFLAPVHQTL